MKFRMKMFLIGLLGTNYLFAQTPAKFDVSLIKPHAMTVEDRSKNTLISGNRIMLAPTVLKEIIMYAFDLKNYQLAGIPDWGTEPSSGYEITAQAEGDQPLTVEAARTMLQTLLVERFQLKFHREKRDVDVYALVVGKGGSKLKELTADAPAAARGQMGMSGATVTIAVGKSTIPTFVTALSYYADRPVLDRTNLAGSYEIRLKFVVNPNAVTATSAPSLFTAVQEQLGLKLDTQKASLDVLVVDHVERPSEN